MFCNKILEKFPLSLFYLKKKYICQCVKGRRNMDSALVINKSTLGCNMPPPWSH